jgi:hypothetical protein
MGCKPCGTLATRNNFVSGTDLKDSFGALSGTKPSIASELTARLLEALEGERKTA